MGKTNEFYHNRDGNTLDGHTEGYRPCARLGVSRIISVALGNASGMVP